MKSQVRRFCDDCNDCLRYKSGNHAQFAVPRVTIAPPIPFASISMDVMDMLATENGYDGVLVVVDNWSKYTVLVPMKCAGLIEAGMLKLSDRKDFRALQCLWGG
eukprot:SAG31_NODE_8271_length_1483_cov_3.692794_2_plen_104_part_00